MALYLAGNSVRNRLRWQQSPPAEFPMRGALSWGHDIYGLYCDLDLTGIAQRMRWIGPGRFRMGSAEDESGRFDDETRHRVTLTSGFWLADTVCTQSLWVAVMGKNPSRFGDLEHPVDSVSWDMAQEFLRKLNEIKSAPGLRLPSEAEWEYACRAGTETAFNTGDRLSTGQANVEGVGTSSLTEAHEGGTVAVKRYDPNDWGLYEMHGNVWEWCADRYGSYQEDEQENPKGPETGSRKGRRVMRGGSWFNSAGGCRSAFRLHVEPGIRYDRVGFRFAQSAPGVSRDSAHQPSIAEQWKTVPPETRRSRISRGLRGSSGNVYQGTIELPHLRISGELQQE